MDINHIRALLQDGESDTVEAKASAGNFVAIEQTACAFANTKGGHIIVGVSEQNKLPNSVERFIYDGISTTPELEQRFKRIGETLQPSVKVEVSQVAVNTGRYIFVITVPRSNGPEMVSLRDGVTYRRKGAVTVKGEIFKPKTASANDARLSREEEISLLNVLISFKLGVASLDDVAGLTNITKDRISTHWFAMSNAGLLNGVSQTTQGTFITITSHVRSKILRRLNELKAISNATSSTEMVTTIVSPVIDILPPADRLPYGVSDHLRFEEQIEAVVQRETSNQGVAHNQAPPTSDQHELDNSNVSKTDAVTDLHQISSMPEKEAEAQDDDALPSKTTNASTTDIADNVSTGGSAVQASAGSRVHICRESRTAALSAKEYGEVIASLLSSSSSDEAMTFALFGHWGRGKTFQMQQIASALESIKNGPKYRSVWFSAWKYRTTPETWIYLFQRLLDEAKKDSLRIPLRAAFSKLGAWPLLAILLSLFISIIPVVERIEIIAYSIQLVGLSAFLYFLCLITGFFSAGLRVYRTYKLLDHSNKLGMQSTIGDDLKILLQAWMPRATKSKTNISIAITVFQLCCYVVLVCGIAAQLHPFLADSMQFTTTPYSALTKFVVSCIILAIYAALAALFLAPLVMYWHIVRQCFAWPKNIAPFDDRRALLILDDLDRCEPKQMLEIIESTLLILDDPAIKSRLQVAILVDEFAFERALTHKYAMLLSDDYRAGDTYCRQLNRLVRENKEKCFLLQFRLPDLEESEISEITVALSNDLMPKVDEKSRFSDSAIDDSELLSTQAIDLVEKPEQNISSAEDANASDVVLHNHERDHLMSAIVDQIRNAPSIIIGPRSINCILHRYQMARAILRKTNVSFDTGELAKAVVREYLSPSTTKSSVNSVVASVAKQVS